MDFLCPQNDKKGLEERENITEGSTGHLKTVLNLSVLFFSLNERLHNKVKVSITQCLSLRKI